MKYLLLATIVSVLFVFVYSRLRPYLQAIHKVITFLNSTNSQRDAQTKTKQSAALEHRLVRCAGCGTWIPGDRVLNLRSGATAYCSRECLEQRAVSEEKKMVG